MKQISLLFAVAISIAVFLPSCGVGEDSSKEKAEKEKEEKAEKVKKEKATQTKAAPQQNAAPKQ